MQEISHIRKLSKKKITIDRIVAQINNSATTSWDLESVKLYLNEMTAKVIINESYNKLLTIFVTEDTSLQNNEQTNLAETQHHLRDKS